MATHTPKEVIDKVAGIGAAKAQAILDYRTQHGPFTRIEDVMNVKGIGEGIFQQLEPYVTVTDPEGGQP